MIRRKTLEEIEVMRESGRIVAEALEATAAMIGPGVATADIDAEVESVIRSRGAVPSFKGYRGFPASACISVNEEVVHGIPGSRTLSAGDLVSVDVGAFKNGFHGDSARTFAVGEVDTESRALMEACLASLQAAVEAVKPGSRLWEISAAAEAPARKSPFAIVEQYVGHGIGRDLHEDPQIPNYVAPGFAERDGSLVLEVGMVLAIEPMLNAGTKEVATLPDRWTVVTADGRVSTHFEHTVAVVEDGYSVLTQI